MGKERKQDHSGRVLFDFRDGRSRKDRAQSNRSPEHYYEKRSRSRKKKGWSPRGAVQEEKAPPTRRPVGYAYGEGRHKARNALAGGTTRKQPSHASESSLSSAYSSDSEGSSSVLDDDEVVAKKATVATEKKASGKDEIIHFDWSSDMLLNSRYELRKALGDGTFGRVVGAYDRKYGRLVAIKIIRDVKRYMENAKIEAAILKDVLDADPRSNSRCAIMYDTFTHDGKYFCLVFETLGVSLYEFMKKNAFRGFWMQDVQDFAQQCLLAVKFLHEQLKLAHTDLKPENILLQSTDPPRHDNFPRLAQWKAVQPSTKKEPGPYLRPASSQIKVIDFGNATYEDEHHSSIINTRQYRSPEVVLELGWNERSDIWSLGCIFVELYSGELLFGTHENLEHLALMEKVLTPLPENILNGALSQVKEKYLQQERPGAWRLAWPAKASSAASQNHVQTARTLGEIISVQHHRPLVSLVGWMLTADARYRPSASQVLRDPFFTTSFAD